MHDEPISGPKWINYLTNFGYGKYFLLEIKAPESPVYEIFNNMIEKFKEAQDKKNRGDHKGSLNTCREIFIELQTLINSNKNELELSLNAGSHPELPHKKKFERIIDILSSIKYYLGMGSHGEAFDTFTYRDSEFALDITLVLLKYASEELQIVLSQIQNG
ncbi:hypothetical protein KAR91_50515 [Candidatus Pacearchaeota archaeon]|nr:hypothetical protein [Candidatus Pacearchaeota archaeon]